MNWRYELVLAGGGGALAAVLAAAGHSGHAGVVAVIGAAGVTALRWCERARPRWPRLQPRLGRRALDGADERLDPTLDAAEDALDAIDAAGHSFAAALRPIADGVLDLASRALALSRLRRGHEATLARIYLAGEARELEGPARAELARLNGELEQVRATLAVVGPSVRHLSLIGRAAEIDPSAPSDLSLRLATLREALAEELGHVAA